jgi:autotransporter translocation and assembly factor TamB
MKNLPLVVKLLAAFLLLVLLVVGAGVMLVNSKAFQQRVLQQATQILSDRLQTKVSILLVNSP